MAGSAWGGVVEKKQGREQAGLGGVSGGQGRAEVGEWRGLGKAGVNKA